MPKCCGALFCISHVLPWQKFWYECTTIVHRNGVQNGPSQIVKGRNGTILKKRKGSIVKDNLYLKGVNHSDVIIKIVELEMPASHMSEANVLACNNNNRWTNQITPPTLTPAQCGLNLTVKEQASIMDHDCAMYYDSPEGQVSEVTIASSSRKKHLDYNFQKAVLKREIINERPQIVPYGDSAATSAVPGIHVQAIELSSGRG